MFTGIIRHLGIITSKNQEADGAVTLTIETSLSPSVHEGDSVAVNGVCLTVLKNDEKTWTARLMQETLKKTNLGDLEVGNTVNLERPLSIGDVLDGHFVQGHVDGMAEVTNIEYVGDDTIFTFKVSPDLIRYFIPKGSVAIDGVSLTVIDVLEDSFTVSIMPYTREMTTFGKRAQGEHVNIEVDMIGKYVQSFLRHDAAK